MNDKFFPLVIKELKSSLLDYLLLFTGSILFLLCLKIFQGQRLMSFFIVLSFVSLYVVWGIFHHSAEKTLNLKSVIEYLFIGATILLLLTVVFAI
jgi:RsiW-degrading membrane proteinase PrsW (M82 family)